MFKSPESELSGRGLSRFEKLMEASPDMACSVDVNSNIIQVNAASEAILGYKPSELIGKNLFDFIHPDDKEAAIKKAQGLMAGYEVVNFENRYLRRDGSVVYLSWSSQWDASDGIRFGTARDVTERRKQEDILAASEKKYWNLFENSPLPVLLWDLQTSRFIDCNAAALVRYGYSKEEFLKLSVKDLWPPGDNEIALSDIISTIDDDKIFRTTRRHLTKNGDIIQVDLSGQMVTQNGRKMALAMINDITDQHFLHELDKLERELLQKCAGKDAVLSEALNCYLVGVEKLHKGIQCSIFENRGGRLFNLSSPGLPSSFLGAIEGATIGGNFGPCSLAAFLKEATIISDIQCAPLSAAFKDAARRHHLQACWSHPILDASGEVMATFGCFRNDEAAPTMQVQKTIKRVVNILQLILEGRRRERELKISNNRFEKVTEATYDVIWDWDIEADTVFYSDNFTSIFGHEAGLTHNNHQFFVEHVHPDDLEAALLQPEEAQSKGMSNWIVEYRFKKADGEYAFVRDRAVVVKDENGKVIRMIGALKDITEQKREEQRLKLLESVITNTTDAVLITDACQPDNSGPRIVYVNEAFTRMTGYTAAEITGKTPRILQGPRTDVAELKRMSDCMRKQEACEFTVINYKNNGDEFWNECAVSPVLDEHGICTNFIAIERDVTDKKNRELQKTLMAEIGSVFAETGALQPSLQKAIDHLARFGPFSMAEIWLSSTDNTRADLIAKAIQNDGMKLFYEDEQNSKSIFLPSPANASPTGLPPYVFWHHLEGKKLLRHEAVLRAGLKTAYIVPLQHDNNIIGILVLGSDKEEKLNIFYARLFEQFGSSFGVLIKRKLLEDELNQVFNFTPDILCTLHTDGFFKKVNPAMCAILEYSEQELLSRPFTSFIHPLDLEKTSAEFRNVIDGHPTYYIENRYLTKSGRIKWLAWTSTAASEQGIVYCAAKDATEKKELENLLNKANVLARIGSWEVDTANGKIFWSDITRDIHEVEAGYNPDREKAINFYCEGPDRDTIVDKMTAAIKRGEHADVELQIITARGHIKWVRVIIEAEFVNGKCLRTYGSIQDIDDRKRAELASMNALRERTTILESIGDGFFAVDNSWVVTYWNNMAEKALMTPRDKILNKKLWDVFDSSVGSVSFFNYQEAARTRQRIFFEDYYQILDRWFGISVYPSDTGLSVFFKDITDRKKSELRLKELNESLSKHARELAISNAELEQFAYVASHDLQEPLRMVTNFMTQLERKYADALDEKGRQYIHFAVDGAKRMREIILDLLDFSTIGKLDNDIEPVDFNKLANNLLALYRQQIEETGATITFSNLPTFTTFRTPMRQVLQNLLGNSLKYAKQGVAPLISISCQEMPAHFQFSVKDNGIGIAPEFFDKIFIIFQRLHNKDEYSGTGMGLAITKKIVERLGGKLWVESEEGVGSTFNFTALKSPPHEVH